MKSKNPEAAEFTADRHFIREFIPRVSRTFALAIGFLPPRLRHPVYTAYLLCRVADTIEDSPYLKCEDKAAKLMHLHRILLNAEKGIGIDGHAISHLNDSIIAGHGDDHRLLSQSRQLFGILSKLPAEQQTIIYHWTAEMALGMAQYSKISAGEDGRIGALKDLDDWDKYCYHVAGTVGHMLTDLFISYYKIPNDVATKLREFASSFGLGLQKVNVIKDVPNDRTRGACFLPYSVMTQYSLSPEMLRDASNSDDIRRFVTYLVNCTSPHLDDAIEYTILFPARHKGVRMFLSVPILLAVETLNLIRKKPVQTMTGPSVKISRRDVIRLVTAAGKYSSSDNGLRKYYSRLKK